MAYILPLFISFLTGWLILIACLGRALPRSGLLFFTAPVLGLAINGLLIFPGFWIFGSLHAGWAVGVNLAALGGLLMFQLSKPHRRAIWLRSCLGWTWTDAAYTAVFGLCGILIWQHCLNYPYGGWDAWSCWNLKAKFLFLGGGDWGRMFDPVLWRSNIQYPLLLPLMNVWLWIFQGNVDQTAPMLITLLFGVCVPGILTCLAREYTRHWLSILPGLLLITLPFYVQLAASQYSDNILACFLLLACGSLVLVWQQRNAGWMIVCGLSLGILSFSKSEGLVAAAILFAATLLYTTVSQRLDGPEKKKFLLRFLIAAALSFIPTVVFQLFYAPDNHTLINGLSSASNPSTPTRLKIILMFMGMEVVSAKWYGVWILLAAGLLLHVKSAFAGILKLIPLTIALYLGVAFLYYYINTYFEIAWWLSVSLNRILLALLPTSLLWAWFSVGESRTEINE